MRAFQWRTVSCLYEILLIIVGDKSNGAQPPFWGRKFLLFDEASGIKGWALEKHYMLRLLLVAVKCRYLANIYTLQKVMISNAYQSPTSPRETSSWMVSMAIFQLLGDIDSEGTFTKIPMINGHKIALLSIFLKTHEE
jgi:hypothetical protein